MYAGSPSDKIYFNLTLSELSLTGPSELVLLWLAAEVCEACLKYRNILDKL